MTTLMWRVCWAESVMFKDHLQLIHVKLLHGTRADRMAYMLPAWCQWGCGCLHACTFKGAAAV